MTESQAAPAAPPLDLNETTPLTDFAALLKRPRELFSFFGEPGPLSTWVVLKGVFGLCFLTWLAVFVTGRFELERSLAMINPMLDSISSMVLDQAPWLLGNGSENAVDYKSRVAAMLMTAMQTGMFLKPFTTLFVLVFTAATAYFFLPWVGVEKSRRSFGKIYMAGVFANWFAFLGVIPILGGFVAGVCEVVFYTLAIQWMYRISFFRSLLAVYLLGWLMVGLTVIAGAVILIALLASMGG